MRPQNNKFTINTQRQEVHNSERTGARCNSLQFQSRNNVQQQQQQRLFSVSDDLAPAEDSYSNLSSNSLVSAAETAYVMKRASRENKQYHAEVSIGEQGFQVPMRAPLPNFVPFNGQRPIKLSGRQLQQLEAEQLAQKAAEFSKQQQSIQEKMLNIQASNNQDQQQRYLRNEVHQQLQRVYGQANDQDRIALTNTKRTNQKSLDEIQHEFFLKQQQQAHLKERINEQLHYRKQQQREAAAAEVVKQQHQLSCGTLQPDSEDQFLHEQYRLISMNQRARKGSSISSAKAMNQDDMIYEQLASDSLLNDGAQEDSYANRRSIKMMNQHHQAPFEMIREETSSEYDVRSDCIDTKALAPAAYGLTGSLAAGGGLRQQQQQHPPPAQQVYERPTIKQNLPHRQQTYLNLPQLLIAPTTRQLQPVTLPIALATDESIYERSLIPTNGFMYSNQQANSNIALRAELISRLLFGSGIFNQLKGRFLEPYHPIPVAPSGALMAQSRPTIGAVYATAGTKAPQVATCGPLYGVIDKKQLAPVAGARPLSIIATTMGSDSGGGSSITELKTKPNVSIRVNELMDGKKKTGTRFNLKHLWISIFLLAIGTTFIAIFFNFR